MSPVGILDAQDCGEFVCATEKESMNQLNQHPIMITFRDAISGDGFLAGITDSWTCLDAQRGRRKVVDVRCASGCFGGIRDHDR